MNLSNIHLNLSDTPRAVTFVLLAALLVELVGDDIKAWMIAEPTMPAEVCREVCGGWVKIWTPTHCECAIPVAAP